MKDRSRAISFAVLFVSLAIGLGVIARKEFNRVEPAGPPSPVVLTPSQFDTLGRKYGGYLAKTYASAFESGAAALEAGRGPSDALDAIANQWAKDRPALFARYVIPELSKVLPEGKADPTAGELAALAKSFRSFAVGLRRCR